MRFRSWAKRFLAIAGAMAVVAFLGARAYGIDLGDLLKVGGIGYVVRQSGGAINKAINTVTLNRGVKNEQMTKVVPVLSFGQGGYIGAVQVSGPPQLVKKVEGVAQLETGLSAFGNSVRARILVPIDTNDARKGFHRVQGVGVSALVDLRI